MENQVVTMSYGNRGDLGHPNLYSKQKLNKQYMWQYLGNPAILPILWIEL